MLMVIFATAAGSSSPSWLLGGLDTQLCFLSYAVSCVKAKQVFPLQACDLCRINPNTTSRQRYMGIFSIRGFGFAQFGGSFIATCL